MQEVPRPTYCRIDGIDYPIEDLAFCGVKRATLPAAIAWYKWSKNQALLNRIARLLAEICAHYGSTAGAYGWRRYNRNDYTVGGFGPECKEFCLASFGYDEDFLDAIMEEN